MTVLKCGDLSKEKFGSKLRLKIKIKLLMLFNVN